MVGCAVIGLSACSSFEGNNEVEKLQVATSVGSPFTQQLTAEYKAFSDFELKNEKDYTDALHFARKGLESAEGVNVMPEPVNDWDLTMADIQELSTAYARLVSAFGRGARELFQGKPQLPGALRLLDRRAGRSIKGNTATVPCKADFMSVMSEEVALPAVAPVMEEFPSRLQ